MTQHSSRFGNVFWVLSLGLILTFISFTIFEIIYNKQKSAFIDEIFHIPQAKLYCEGQWTEWNPKITTLPGLYIVSYVFLKPLEKLGRENFCSVYALRLTNLAATIFNFFLAYAITCRLEEKYLQKVKSSIFLKVLTAYNVAIFPPLYFFTFLYYTDVWSITFVLLLYYSHLLEGRFCWILGTFAGFMAVLMRQTNVIWVGLMIIDDIWNVISKNLNAVPVQDYKHSKKVFQKFSLDYFTVKSNLRTFFVLIQEIWSRTFHNVGICLIFVAFVLINKGIVLGDKEAHAAVIHPMQNLYFLEFMAFFGWPFLIKEIPSLWKKPPNFFLIVFLVGLTAGLSETNKLEHPYLLADNRHFAFYLWKRVFGHPTFRRLIIPTYVGSGILLFRLLQRRCHFMFMVMLSFCTVLNLTPQYLFELRYFIVPFLMYRLQFKLSAVVFLETAFYSIINAVVIYLFLSRPFVWNSEPGVKQRFIW